jgi:hypothetical protein
MIPGQHRTMALTDTRPRPCSSRIAALEQRRVLPMGSGNLSWRRPGWRAALRPRPPEGARPWRMPPSSGRSGDAGVGRFGYSSRLRRRCDVW